MLISHRKGNICITSTNDVDYALANIPKEIIHYQNLPSLSMSTKVSILINIDGTYLQNIFFRDSDKVGETNVTEVKKRLKTNNREVTLNGVQVKQTFMVQITLAYEYTLKDHIDQALPVAITIDLVNLKKAGFVMKAPLREEDEAV